MSETSCFLGTERVDGDLSLTRGNYARVTCSISVLRQPTSAAVHQRINTTQACSGGMSPNWIDQCSTQRITLWPCLVPKNEKFSVL